MYNLHNNESTIYYKFGNLSYKIELFDFCLIKLSIYIF
jgi:hypothetical protein